MSEDQEIAANLVELHSKAGVKIHTYLVLPVHVGYPTVIIHKGCVYIKTNENRYQACDWFQFVEEKL